MLWVLFHFQQRVFHTHDARYARAPRPAPIRRRAVVSGGGAWGRRSALALALALTLTLAVIRSSAVGGRGKETDGDPERASGGYVTAKKNGRGSLPLPLCGACPFVG